MAHGMASLVGWGSPLPIYCDQQRRQSFYDPQLLQWSFYAKTGRAPAASEAAAPSSEVHSRLESEQFENAVGQIFATSGLDVQSNMYYDGAGTRQEGTFALHEARKFLFQRHLEKNQKAETAQSAWEVHSEQLCAGGFLSFLRVANAWMRNNILEQAPPQPLGRKGEKLYEVDVVVTKPMTWQESEDLPPVCFIENGESGRREFTLATFMRSCLQQTTFIEVTFESQLRDRKLRQFEFHKVLQEHKPNSGSLLLYNGSEFCAAPSRRPNHTRLLWVSKSQVMSFETRLERIRRDAAEQAAQADRIRREEAEQAAQADRMAAQADRIRREEAEQAAQADRMAAQSDRIRREEAEQAAQAERVRREAAEQRREDAIKALQQIQKEVEQLRKSDASSAWQGERSK